MKQFYGSSSSGDLKSAVSGLSHPKLIILMSNGEQFEQHVEELENLFPNVPSIGCIDMAYDTQVTEKGVAVTAYTEGVSAVANILENVSKTPARHIRRLEDDIAAIKPGKDNTVCIDFCAGNDACVLTTIYSLLGRRNIVLMGGTGDAAKVSCNGKVYPDGTAYALIKNETGKVQVYKENIYQPMGDFRFIASRTDREKYYIGELNGKSAKQVYMDTLGIPESAITTQTFKNPFGKITGKDVCIISIKEVAGSGLACFRQVNDSDVLTLLELRDYRQIAQDTIDRIHADFNHISAVFSVNCLFRYLLFSENNNMEDYLRQMSSLGNHCGFVGYGEHYNNQFVNQSMTCVVFE